MHRFISTIFSLLILSFLFLLVAPTAANAYSILTHVFIDNVNYNCAQDVGEQNRSGATITVSGPVNPPSQTTDSSGNTTFTGLPAGWYQVNIDLNNIVGSIYRMSPAWSEDNWWELPPNAAVNFCIVPTYKISGHLYFDLDGDNLYDPTEPGWNSTSDGDSISGLRLYTITNPYRDSDNNGYYEYIGLS